MARYGQAAVRAVALVSDGQFRSIAEAWSRATSDVGQSDPDKCPKSAFFGLCEEGLVRGVPAGDYSRSKLKLNKQYALEALRLIGEDKAKARLTPKELWAAVMERLGIEKAYNDQMEVVLDLWNEGLIGPNEN